MEHRLSTFLASCTTPEQRELRQAIIDEINKKPVLCFKHEDSDEDGDAMGPLWVKHLGQAPDQRWTTLSYAQAMAKVLNLDLEEM